MLDINKISINCHSSIRIEGEKVIYIDPYKIQNITNDADYIFITHSHYDHFSPEDIEKVIKKDTVIIVPEEMENIAEEILKDEQRLYVVEPGNFHMLGSLDFETIPAYNNEKEFHPKEKCWVGYNIKIEDTWCYIAGDTDVTEENKKVKCDIALLPIGGTYTMDYKKAIELVQSINPKAVIPTHYGCIVGDKELGDKFKEKLNSNIDCILKI